MVTLPFKGHFVPYLVGAVLLSMAVWTVHQHSVTHRGLPTLTVFAPSSFASPTGAGPKLAALFEFRHQCHVRLVDVSDGGLILQRLLLEQGQTPADVVLGLDQLHVPEARRLMRWRGLRLDPVKWSESFPQQLIFPDFVPFDWAPLTFIYKNGELPRLESLDDLLRPEFKGRIALEDPRTSTGGLQFLFWILGVKGVDDGFRFLQSLKPNIHSVSPSWSTAYGLFRRGQAQMAFSYLTSPVYHWQVDHDERYQPLTLPVEHSFQLEYAAVLQACTQCGLAQSFVRFLLEGDSQKILMERNFMLPVIEGVTEGSEFHKLPLVKLLPIDKTAKLIPDMQQLLERWAQIRF